MYMRGYTLTELVVVVAILGILATIGIPMYLGYADTAKISAVQNNLRSIYLQQQDYFVDNNAYYATGAACGDFGANINTNLFNGTQVLTADGFNYCITQAADVTVFTAMAVEVGGTGRIYTIDQTNTANF